VTTVAEVVAEEVEMGLEHTKDPRMQTVLVFALERGRDRAFWVSDPVKARAPSDSGQGTHL
jgi:hypothetical protein